MLFNFSLIKFHSNLLKRIYYRALIIYPLKNVLYHKDTYPIRFFYLKFIKIIFHADSAHFIHKFEESNATTAGGYSAKWLPTGTTEMEARRHVCVHAGKSNRPDGK